MATVIPVGVPVATRRKRTRTYTPRPASPKQQMIRNLFRQAANYCKQAVAHLPPGQKRAAYNRCVGDFVRSRYTG